MNGARRAGRRRLAAALLAALVGLVLSGLATGGRIGGSGGWELCVEAIDVGQGDALLVELPAGERWLVDGGGDPSGRYDVGERRLLPALRRAGVDRLDAVFATHGDADHVGGLFAVVRRLPVDELWVPGRRGASAGLRSLVEAAERRGIPVHEAEAGATPEAAAPAEVALLHPGPGTRLPSGAGSNDRSIVLRVALGRVATLLTGDVEATAEGLLLAGSGPLRSAVLKVPHHASRSSSTPAFLDAVDPLVALAGIGEGNRYGFPHASVARRYLLRGTPLYRTDRHGGLRACTDGFELWLSARSEHGRLRPLRRWDAEAVASWSAVGAARVAGGTPTARRTDPAPPPSRRPARRGTPRTAPEPTPEGTPAPKRRKRGAAPDDKDPHHDREWDRSRRARGRLRPPW